MKYIQPINSNPFGRNSLPLLPLFYHFLQDRLEGMVAITEGYFHSHILRMSPLLGLLCTNVCWDHISIAPRFSVLWLHTQDMCLVFHRWEGKGQIPEKHQLSPSDKRNTQGRKSSKIFLKFSKYINHSVATLSWLEIQNRKRKLFYVSISSEPAAQRPGGPVFEDPRVVTGRTDSRHSMQPVLRQKLQHGVWAFRILVATSHSSWVAKKKQAFLWSGGLANNSKKQLKDRFIPGMMPNTKQFLRWLPKV